MEMQLYDFGHAIFLKATADAAAGGRLQGSPRFTSGFRPSGRSTRPLPAVFPLLALELDMPLDDLQALLHRKAPLRDSLLP
jgi:hypothetical protein